MGGSCNCTSQWDNCSSCSIYGECRNSCISCAAVFAPIYCRVTAPTQPIQYYWYNMPSTFLKIKNKGCTGYCFCRISGRPDIRLTQQPDTGYPAGYPVRAGYRISGKGRIPDIRPDTRLDNYTYGKISNKFLKTALTIIGFCKH
jgi:hypothetical protein